MVAALPPQLAGNNPDAPERAMAVIQNLTSTTHIVRVVEVIARRFTSACVQGFG
jgi:hypothetical protein